MCRGGCSSCGRARDVVGTLSSRTIDAFAIGEGTAITIGAHTPPLQVRQSPGEAV